MSSSWNSDGSGNGDDEFETEEIIEIAETPEAVDGATRGAGPVTLRRVMAAVAAGAATLLAAYGGAGPGHSARSAPSQQVHTGPPIASAAAEPSDASSAPIAIATPPGGSGTFAPCCGSSQTGGVASGTPQTDASTPAASPTGAIPTPVPSSEIPAQTPVVDADFTAGGTDLAVTGSGFTPGAQVDLLWDHTYLDQTTATVDGSIQDDIPVWPGLVGRTWHTLTAQQIGAGAPVVAQVYVPSVVETVLRSLLG